MQDILCYPGLLGLFDLPIPIYLLWRISEADVNTCTFLLTLTNASYYSKIYISRENCSEKFYLQI